VTGFALHLLRHGAPETPGLLMGRTDGAPTEAGIAACVAQAEGLGIECLVASDLWRCRAAGEAIGSAVDLPLTSDRRWRELDFGDWDGMAVNAVDDGAFGRFVDDPDAHGIECFSSSVGIFDGLEAFVAVLIEVLYIALSR